MRTARQPDIRRLALLGLASPLLGGAISPGQATPELEAAGWRKAVWQGIPPAEFVGTPTGGIAIRGQGQGSFIWRPVQAAPACLSWRWRVDAGPPPTDLTRRGGDDRAIAIAIGFSGFGPDVSLATRTQHALAQAAAGDHRLPRSVLSYVWGGTGREPQPFFASPWTSGITRIRVLRPADAPRGTWVREQVDLAADWRAAFGSANVPPLQEIAISTDAEDTGSPVVAQVEDIRLGPCR